MVEEAGGGLAGGAAAGAGGGEAGDRIVGGELLDAAASAALACDLRQGQRAQEVGEVVGQGVELEPHRVRIVRHGRYVVFQLAEVAVTRSLFAEILRRIDRLRPRPLLT